MAEYLKIPEVAQRLDVSEKTARRMVKGGKLPSVFIGGAYRVSEDDLERYLEAARVEPGDGSGKAQSSLPEFDVGERRKDIYLPWLEFVNRYADRWEEKVRQGGLDRGAFDEWIETMEDLAPVTNRLWREEERDASPDLLRNRGNDDDALIMWKVVSRLLGTLKVVAPAAKKLFEESEFAQFKRDRERLEQEWGRAADG